MWVGKMICIVDPFFYPVANRLKTGLNPFPINQKERLLCRLIYIMPVLTGSSKSHCFAQIFEIFSHLKVNWSASQIKLTLRFWERIAVA